MCAKTTKKRLVMRLLANEDAEGPVKGDALEAFWLALWLAMNGHGWEWLVVDSR